MTRWFGFFVKIYCIPHCAHHLIIATAVFCHNIEYEDRSAIMLLLFLKSAVFCWNKWNIWNIVATAGVCGASKMVQKKSCTKKNWNTKNLIAKKWYNWYTLYHF